MKCSLKAKGRIGRGKHSALGPSSSKEYSAVTSDSRDFVADDEDFLHPRCFLGIRKHFGGRANRAYESLRPDLPISGSDYLEDLCGKAEFYRAMRGDPILLSRARRIELKWVLFDKGDPCVAEIPEADAELAGWVDREFGYVANLHKALFPDWSPSTLQKAVRGTMTPARLKELRYRFHAYRAEENESRRTEATKFCLWSKYDKWTREEIENIETARDEELKNVEDHPENIRRLYIDAIGRIRADERDRRQGEFDFPEDPA